MSPKAESMLLNEIIPIITATVPRVVKIQSGEDTEEVIQDTLAQAVDILEAAERQGKLVAANSVAWYAINNAKSGRRTGFSQGDALSAYAQIKGRSFVQSMDEVLVPEGDEESDLTLHNILAHHRDDPATEAGRNIDWDELSKCFDKREKYIIHATGEGLQLKEIAEKFGISSPRAIQIKQRIADIIRNNWGNDILQEAGSDPMWKKCRKYM